MNFDPRDEADLLRVIAEYPLAWVVSCGGSGFSATPLPLLAEPGPDGRIVSLLGHFAASNPQVALLRESAQAAILFMGPNGYVSPEVVSKADWAPTWNYATVQFNVEIELLPGENGRALDELVAAMERGRARPWTVAKMGARYERMVKQIVAFRAHVRSVRGRFKLGQDETPQTRSEILQHLAAPQLVSWMADFNPEPPASPSEKP